MDRIDPTKKDKDLPLRVPPCFPGSTGRYSTGAYFLTLIPMKPATILQRLEKLTQGYSLYSQDAEGDPRFVAKLFDIA